MNRMRLTGVALLLALLLMACSDGRESTAGNPQATPKAASGVPTLDSAGLDAYLKAHAGKPTLLIFWATWCPSCKQALPEMEGLAGSRGDKANIMAVSLDEDLGQLKAYLDQHPMKMAVFSGGRAMAERFGVEAIPTLVIFDKLGNQIFGKPGAFPQAMLEKVVDDLNSK
ncbi:TlpA disulfide reductase family protein [Pseudodesulfovibrio sp.]|uniref:TlpA family protein disulfide reductase n=1 Tax=Pseudodesulfovibrio sp. TaxID=2035812 RepID=UPI00260D54E4|nr:TlpA disulfide reductase family protein [Pseudodesulfovibrio sp.]MDD3312296.1 TlpA disulfide reductase family protein [Pseudodesulfovibrio sp.]